MLGLKPNITQKIKNGNIEFPARSERQILTAIQNVKKLGDFEKAMSLLQKELGI